MKNVLILGSTGSIGKSTLEVIDNNDNFNVVSLVAKNQKDLLLEQANKFNAYRTCGHSSVVERLVANEKVEGSTPFARSKIYNL